MLLRKLKICLDCNIKRPMPVGSFKNIFSRDCPAKNNFMISQTSLFVISILIRPLIAARVTVSVDDITGIV
jgi:hypothetical protein